MKTEILVITDRSGSMSNIKADCDGGFASFVEEQKKISGECRVTMVKFDTEVITEYVAKPLAEVPPLNLIPRGSTALMDAMGLTMDVQGKRIKEQAWADLVIVVVITDGHENASTDYTREAIKTMTEHAQKAGWKFVFLAANQDAFSTGASYGISGQHTQNFAATPAGTRMAYASTSAMVGNLRAGGH